MNHKIAFLLALALFALMGLDKAKAQEVLRLEDAVKIALERNYDIKISANNLDIDRNNVNRANAGMLPVIGGTLTNNNSIQNSTQTRSTGEVTERTGARGGNLNYGIALDWTIFDGFAMFARYEQLQELQRLGEANLQLTVLTRVADVINNYYNLVQQQQQLRAYDTAITISRLRLTTAQNRFEIGKAARLEVLNAEVDFNTDTTNLLRQQEQYLNTQTYLNELMARDVNQRFSVIDGINIDDVLNLNQLTDLAMAQNPTLRAALVSRRIAELDLKQVKANRYPAIGLTTGYNFSRSESALGFATLSTGRGFNYGLTASINIFNGFLQRRYERNAGIQIENAQLDFERLNQNVKSQLTSAFQTYLTNLQLVRLEENNQKLAKRNMEITLDKYRLGTLTPVEFRDAQLNYTNATVRFSNAQYEAKLAEIALKQIAGALNVGS